MANNVYTLERTSQHIHSTPTWYVGCPYFHLDSSMLAGQNLMKKTEAIC